MMSSVREPSVEIEHTPTPAHPHVCAPVDDGSPQISSSSTSTYRTLSPLHRRFSLKDPVLLKNFIIGFSDGVTVPFALTAGLGSLGDKHLIIEAGLAELFAGAISMALGTWLAARTERIHYQIAEAKERKRFAVGQISVSQSVKEDVEANAGGEKLGARADGCRMVENQIMRIFGGFGFRRHDVHPMSKRLSKDDGLWVKVSFQRI